MDFVFTEEQQMIRVTAEKFLGEVSDGIAVRHAMETDQGFDANVWQRLCSEMYWQAIHIPEAYGGLGLGYVELVAVLEQMGRFQLCSPFFSTVCLATNALLIAGTEAQKMEYLPQIAEGSLKGTLAYSGKGGRWDSQAVDASYSKSTTAAGDQYILNGSYQYVIDGHTADLLIIAARASSFEGRRIEVDVEESNEDTNSISLFAVPANLPGIERQWLPTMDQTRRQARVNLTNVPLPSSCLMGEEGRGGSQLQDIIDLATIALAAEQMGGAQQVLDMSVAYCKERVQFNRTIASFQAVKHKAADMMVRAEAARSAVYYAACIAEDSLHAGPLAEELQEAASVAKACCSDAFFANAGEGIQLFGGVGFTWEYDVHLYFKRAKSSELYLGNSAYHRSRIARLLLDTEASL